ncbi:MAG: sensor domain-containing diguanylate cyclase [Candidatus Pacearchaeota archaeon]
MVDEKTLVRLAHSAKELKVLKLVNKAISSTENINVMINRVVNIIVNEFKVGLIFFVLEENEKLKIMNLDENRPLNEHFQELVLVIAEDTVKYSSPILIKQTRQGTLANRFGIKSFVSVPLMLHEGPIGSIILMARFNSFGPGIVKILSAVANQVASAIEHLWLKRAVEEKEKKILKLYSKLYSKEAKRAIVDALTGLFNKRYFVELLDSEAKKGKQLSLVMFDLDFFKNYNDTFGHLEGDNLLRAAGKVIQKVCKNMKACRYGGEEFAIIVEADANEAAMVAEKLRQAIEALYPKQAKRVVTASFGVAQRKRGEDIETFIKRADNALYKSKESGRNKVTIAN